MARMAETYSVTFSVMEFNLILSILATEIPTLTTEIYKGLGHFC
jgi:hypothetical protein